MFGFKIRRAAVALLVYGAFLIGLVYLADAGRGGRMFALVNWIPGRDKTGHFLLFGVLSFLVNDVLRGVGVRRAGISVLKGNLILMIIVTLEESSQRLFAARSFDLWDLAADYLGIWLFGMLAVRYLAFKQARIEKRIIVGNRILSDFPSGGS